MRLKERQLVSIEIAPRACVKGALDSVTEGFGEKTKLSARAICSRSGSFTPQLSK